MLKVSSTLDTPVSVTQGASLGVASMHPITVYLTGTFVATLQLQISADGTNWIDEGTALTAPGTILVDKPCEFMRWDVTAYTSGTPATKVVGVAA